MKSKALIKTPTTTMDNERVVQESWGGVGNITGTLLPLSNEYALQEYGYSEKVKYQFFFRGRNEHLKAGNRLVINGEELNIVYVAQYGKVLVILLDSGV